MFNVKRIGVDVDGVLAVFDRSFTDLLIKVSGRDLFPVKPVVPTLWDWPELAGYTKEEEGKAWAAVKADPTFWENLDAYPDTGEVLQRLSWLRDQGHEITFITNRMGMDPQGQTERFLVRNGMLNPSVIVSADKGKSAQIMNLDAYIDDKPSNCDDVVRVRGSVTKTYLLDRPWNQEGCKAASVLWVKSVGQMLDQVFRMSSVMSLA